MAALHAVRDLKKAAPHMPVIIGGSGEFVLGMHGEVEFDGRRLAGLYPHHQAKLAESTGASIYGVAIGGTSTTQSVAWDIAHIFACGMGGIRTAGDLVAWMQLIKKMKITELLDVPINSVDLFKSQTGI